ncbi:hypothetical protein ASE93_00620 [Serratia sp. Leaf50]|nr:hypothetical protein ASE93_00620 [Serratia sp. Leaf50]
MFHAIYFLISLFSSKHSCFRQFFIDLKGILKQRRLFRGGIISGLCRAFQTQKTLVTEPQYVTLFDIIHVHPAKTLLAAAKATTAKTVRTCLTYTTAWTGDVKKLKLLSQNSSALVNIKDK